MSAELVEVRAQLKMARASGEEVGGGWTYVDLSPLYHTHAHAHAGGSDGGDICDASCTYTQAAAMEKKLREQLLAQASEAEREREELEKELQVLRRSAGSVSQVVCVCVRARARERVPVCLCGVAPAA